MLFYIHISKDYSPSSCMHRKHIAYPRGTGLHHVSGVHAHNWYLFPTIQATKLGCSLPKLSHVNGLQAQAQSSDRVCSATSWNRTGSYTETHSSKCYLNDFLKVAMRTEGWKAGHAAQTTEQAVVSAEPGRPEYGSPGLTTPKFL